MKIFYLITKSEAGGAQTHVAQLSNYFVKQGQEVVVMSSGGGWLKEAVEKAGGIFVANNFLDNSFNPSKLIQAGKAINKALADFKPDIVCCHSSLAGFIGRLTVQNKIPTVFTAHGWDFAAYRSWWRRRLVLIAEKITAPYSAKIICVSNFVKELALKNKITEADRFSVIYNGVEILAKGRVQAEKELLEIVFVGRLAKPKNPFMLVNAYAKLSADLKEKSKIIIVGDGPQKKDLINLISKLELNNNVQLVGSLPRNQALALIAEAAVVVLPSFWESFGLSILEAMSMAVPVIASNVGGLKELVTKDSGILVNSTTELTKALEKLLLDQNLRRQFGDKGQERAQNFTVEMMCQKTALLYEEIVKSKI